MRNKKCRKGDYNLLESTLMSLERKKSTRTNLKTDTDKMNE